MPMWVRLPVPASVLLMQVLVNNVTSDADRSFSIPANRICEVGLLYEV